MSTNEELIDQLRDWADRDWRFMRNDYAKKLRNAADALREVKAEAWDEGHSWGWSDAQEAHDVRQGMERSEWRLSTPNPYRPREERA